MKSRLIQLSEINPYDHIHFPTKEEWLAVEGYSQEHLLNDYINHLNGILWGIHQVVRGRKIYPILISPVYEKPYKYQRRNGYKRYKVFEYLNWCLIPCHVATEEEILQFPQEGKFFEEKDNA